MRISLPLVNPSNEKCIGCAALCCHDLTLPVPPPTNEAIIAHLKWRLHFDTVKIGIIKEDWFMMVVGRCMFLDEQNMCSIYETRPQQCQDYNPPFCERYFKAYDRIFSSPMELDAYLAEQANTITESA